MRFTTPLTLASAAITATAIPTGLVDHSMPPLPAGLKSGVHHYGVDDAGAPNITRVADNDLTALDTPDAGPQLEKRVNTWTGCATYGFTETQRYDQADAWASLLNWASKSSNGASDWINGHYFALTDSGAFAYLCEWGSGNHAKVTEINQAKGVLEAVCGSGPGMFQWNEWKKGIGAGVGECIFFILVNAPESAVRRALRPSRSRGQTETYG